MESIILFVVAVVLFSIVAPLGFLFALLSFGKGYWKKLQKYLYSIAITIDQSGNVIGAPLFNWALRKEEGHPFGNEDETISSAVGRNKQMGTLTITGMILDWILNKIDPNHSIDAIGN